MKRPQPLLGPLARSGTAATWIMVAFSILVVLLGGVIVVNRMTAEAALRERLEEMHAAGVPLSGEEVNERYHGHGRDPAENAAPIYDQAFEAMELESPAWREVSEAFRLRPHPEPLSPEAVQAMREVVEVNRTAITRLQEAAARPYLRRDLDFTEGPHLMIPHVGALRNGARLLAAEAVTAAGAGEPERGAEALLAIFRIALHLSEEETLISFLTKLAIEGLGRQALERVLEKVRLEPRALTELMELVEELEHGPRIHTAFLSEVAYGRWFYQKVGDRDVSLIDDEASFVERSFFRIYRLTGLLARDQNFYLTSMQEMLHRTSLPLEEQVEFDGAESEISGRFLEGRILAAMLLPTLDRLAESNRRGIVYLRAMRIGLAAELFRAESGHWPASSSELQPHFSRGIPRDPYGGDFLFRAKDGGLFVASADTFRLPGDEAEVAVGFRLPAP
jgi:hypothetical protein